MYHLFICLSAKYLKYLRMDFKEIFRNNKATYHFTTMLLVKDPVI